MIYEQGLIWQNVKCKYTSPEVVFADSLMLQGRGCVDCRRRKRKSESVLRVRDHSEQRARPRMGTLTGETDEAGCGVEAACPPASSPRVRGGHLCCVARPQCEANIRLVCQETRRGRELGVRCRCRPRGQDAFYLRVSSPPHLQPPPCNSPPRPRHITPLLIDQYRSLYL